MPNHIHFSLIMGPSRDIFIQIIQLDNDYLCTYGEKATNNIGFPNISHNFKKGAGDPNSNPDSNSKPMTYIMTSLIRQFEKRVTESLM